jgi:ABC-type ATPase involved in cell division
MLTQWLVWDMKKDNIALAIMHPGEVVTDMNPKGNFTKDESVEGMLRVFEEINMTTTGSYRVFNGDSMPW